MLLHRLALPICLLTASMAHAQQPPASPPLTFACSGPFAKTSSHAKLQKAFGATSVAIQKVTGSEGESYEVSVLYGATPDKRLDVTWNDEKKHSGLAFVKVKKPSAWTGPAGIHVGMTIQEVAAANGQPFKLNGFEWLYGGDVIELQGKLAALPGGCSMSLRFSPGMPLDAQQHAGLLGEKRLSSTDPKLLAVKPVLTSWSVEYGEND